jgi:hypothetical protein
MSTMNLTEQLEVILRMLLPAHIGADAARTSVRSFWESQERVLCSMDTSARGWFERRRAGTQAALRAAERMCGAETPGDVLRDYQDWASGACKRMMADGLACQQHFMAVLGALELPAVPLVGEQEAARSDQRPSASTRAA